MLIFLYAGGAAMMERWQTRILFELFILPPCNAMCLLFLIICFFFWVVGGRYLPYFVVFLKPAGIDSGGGYCSFETHRFGRSQGRKQGQKWGLESAAGSCSFRMTLNNMLHTFGHGSLCLSLFSIIENLFLLL